MTVQNTSRVIGVYEGDGEITQFPFTFKLFKRNDITVMMSDDGGVTEAPLRLGSDFEVLRNNDQEASPGGTVRLTAPLAVGKRIAIVSALVKDQQVSLTNYGAFYPETLNGVHDRTVALIQEVYAMAKRSVRVPFTSSQTPEELAQAYRDKYNETIANAQLAQQAQASASESAATCTQSVTLAKAVNQATVNNLAQSIQQYTKSTELKNDTVRIETHINELVTQNQALQTQIGASATAVHEDRQTVEDALRSVTTISAQVTLDAQEASGSASTAMLHAKKAETAQEAASLASISAAESRDDAQRSCVCAKTAMWQAHEDVEQAKELVAEVTKLGEDAIESAKQATEAAQSATESAKEATEVGKQVLATSLEVDGKLVEAKDALAQASVYVDEAKQAKDDAQASASTATQQAGIATTKAQEAKASEVTATTKASEASASASVASQKADIATEKAGTATAQASIATAKAEVATTKAQEAETSASTATTKAGEAQASATLAGEKADTATAQATTATEQARIATTKAGEAQTSAQQASNSASTASQKATEAGGSASTATQKASEASSSASTATAQAGVATSKAQEAVDAVAEATKQATLSTEAKVASELARDKAIEAAENAVAGQVQSDWNETDPLSKAFIKNKPDIHELPANVVTDENFGTKARTFNELVTFAKGATFSNARVTGVAPPVDPSDAINKKYFDDIIGIGSLERQTLGALAGKDSLAYSDLTGNPPETLATKVYVDEKLGEINPIQGGAAHLAGDIVFAINNYVPFGAVVMRGQELRKSDYPQLWAKVKDQAIEYSAYENEERNNNGDCHFYGNSGGENFKLPRVTGWLRAGASYGHLKESLPDITATLPSGYNSYTSGDADGLDVVGGAAYYEAKDPQVRSKYAGAQGMAGNYDRLLTFKASRSNEIYGRTQHVQPETSVLVICVYVVNVGGAATSSGNEATSEEVKELKNQLDRLNGEVAGIRNGRELTWTTIPGKPTDRKLAETYHEALLGYKGADYRTAQIITNSDISGNNSLGRRTYDALVFECSGSQKIAFKKEEDNVFTVKCIVCRAKAQTALTVEGVEWVEGHPPTWGEANSLLVFIVEFIAGKVLASVYYNGTI